MSPEDADLVLQALFEANLLVSRIVVEPTFHQRLLIKEASEIVNGYRGKATRASEVQQ